MFSTEAYLRALGKLPSDQFNPDAQLDPSRMSDQPVAIPGLSFNPTPDQGASLPQQGGQQDIMQLLMAILGGGG